MALDRRQRGGGTPARQARGSARGSSLSEGADDPTGAGFLQTLPERVDKDGRASFIEYHAHGGRIIHVQAYPEPGAATTVLLRDITEDMSVSG